MDKSALEHLLSSYNWWMGVSTVAVAIGILGEYVAHFVFEKEARRNRLEMAISILFGAFVLGGVVGEYIFGSKLSEVAGQLQRMADAEVAQSNNDAAAARREAEIARKEADSLELQIAKANERAANAEKETTVLRERFADRRLTEAQVAEIVSKLKPFAGQEFDLTPYWDLKESVAITNRILGALNLAGWKYTPPKQSGFMLGGVAGVLVYVHPAATQQTKNSASSLVSALNGQGIVAELRQQNPANPIDNVLHLNIGTKP